MKTQFFAGCKTAQDVKTKFRDLVKEHHPDKGGNPETMKLINNEYTKALNFIKAGGSFEETGSGAGATTADPLLTDPLYKAAFEAVETLPGVIIELIGNWIWLSGNTYPHRAIISGAGFHWANTKKMWYYRTDENKTNNRKAYDINEIRAKHGSKTVANNKQNFINK